VSERRQGNHVGQKNQTQTLKRGPRNRSYVRCKPITPPARTKVIQSPPASDKPAPVSPEKQAPERAQTPPRAAPKSRVERRRAVRRRQTRLLFVICLAFSALVIATSFPATALVRQHNAIASEKAQLAGLTAGNKALRSQAAELLEPANVDALARRDYDMVQRGEQAYTVLPSSGSSNSSAASTSQNSLNQGVVAPGSSESQDLTGVSSGSARDLAGGGTEAGSAGGHTGVVPDLWNRVMDTLEFWH